MIVINNLDQNYLQLFFYLTCNTLESPFPRLNKHAQETSAWKFDSCLGLLLIIFPRCRTNNDVNKNKYYNLQNEEY